MKSYTQKQMVKKGKKLNTEELKFKNKCMLEFYSDRQEKQIKEKSCDNHLFLL